jgi:hypothetical protein
MTYLNKKSGQIFEQHFNTTRILMNDPKNLMMKLIHIHFRYFL